MSCRRRARLRRCWAFELLSLPRRQHPCWNTVPCGPWLPENFTSKLSNTSRLEVAERKLTILGDTIRGYSSSNLQQTPSTCSGCSSTVAAHSRLPSCTDIPILETRRGFRRCLRGWTLLTPGPHTKSFSSIRVVITRSNNWAWRIDGAWARISGHAVQLQSAAGALLTPATRHGKSFNSLS